jgi:lipid-A-disaccharide synthase
MRELLFVSGEVSGDLHAGAVAEAIRHRAPDQPMAGIGATRLADAGVTLLERSERLQVMGFVEALAHVPSHWALLRRLGRRLSRGQVGAAVLVDYPGFNLRVAERAHAAGVPVLYYITPQVWAWGAGRLEAMRRVITRAAVILPFEAPLLASHGIDATFVGHPLLDRATALPDRAEACARLGLDPARPVLALFPGSRRGELERHLADFVATARRLEHEVAGLQVVVSRAPGIRIDPARCPYRQVESASFTVLRAATAALCKSGTTTLEAAVAGCPHVLAYRTTAVSYAIARRVVRVPHVGLVNLVAGREVAPEFLQGALSPSRLVPALLPLLDPADTARATAVAALAEVRAALGTPGASARVAAMALELVAGA